MSSSKENIKEVSVSELNKLIKDNILVTTNKTKDFLLQDSFINKEIMNFKILDEESFVNFFNFSLPKDTEYLVYKKLGNYNLTKKIMKSITKVIPFYLNNKANSEKLNNLVTADENLELIIDTIKYLEEIKYLTTVKNDIDKKIYSIEVNLDYTSLEYIELNLMDSGKKSELNVVEYDSEEDEIFSTFNKISQLLKEGIPKEKITIYGNENYYKKCKVISNYYNISLDQDISKKLSTKQINLGLDYLNNLEVKGLSLEVFKFLNDNLSHLKEADFKEYYKNKSKEISIKNIELKEVVSYKNIESDTFNKSEHTFILGFNNYDFIKYKKEDDFLKEETKKTLKLETSSNRNYKIEQKLLTSLNNLENSRTRISYSKEIANKEVSVNSIITSDKIKVTKESIVDNSSRGSVSSDIYNFKKYKDKSLKENKEYSQYKILKSSLVNQEIKTKFNNKFKSNIQIDSLEFSKNKDISATLLDGFYKCNFFFYIKNILRLKEKSKNTSPQNIGNYIHAMLEYLISVDSLERYKVYQNDFDNSEFRDAIKADIEKFSNLVVEESKNIDYGKYIYIHKMNKYLFFLTINILEQLSQENFQVFLSEAEMSLKKGQYNLLGKIDSVLKYEDYYFIIDYKTGKSDLDLNFQDIEMGINLQNIIYYILLKEKYNNAKLAGTYRYKVKPKIIKEEEQNQLSKNNLSTREGYTLEDENVLENIEVSNYRNLSYKKDGDFTKDSKLLTEEEVAQLVEITNNKIAEFINFIEADSIYKVNPLKNEEPCKYCTYKDICYKNKKDYRYV